MMHVRSLTPRLRPPPRPRPGKLNKRVVVLVVLCCWRCRWFCIDGVSVSMRKGWAGRGSRKQEGGGEGLERGHASVKVDCCVVVKQSQGKDEGEGEGV